MTDNRKEQERAELHRVIWNIANDLRGSVDGWDFKQYVLGMLFYRYISENLTAYLNKRMAEAGIDNVDYTEMGDEEAEIAREEILPIKGFFILPSELFANVCRRAALDENLNETLEKTFKHIEQSAVGTDSEDNFKGLFDDLDVNSKKLGDTVAKRNDKLVKLLYGVRDMNLGNYQDNTIDAFGDAYEFLMGMYASNAGKSGGEYYTPQEVSELLARITTVGKTSVNKVYDPACGSGSLLLKFAKILGTENVREGFFGQEINITTYNLCRINMFLHDVGYDKFDIALGDTLTEPQHWDDEPFEAIVSNPPYSIKWEGEDNATLINDPRFAPAGVLAPKSKADLAFILHSLSWLATDGAAALVCFPGVMYRGGKERKIRKYLIENNYVDCIIQLPDNLKVVRQLDDTINVVVFYKVLAYLPFLSATVHDAGETDKRRRSIGGQPRKGMKDKGQVCLGLGGENASRGETGIVDKRGVVFPLPFDGIRGIGDDGFKGLIIPVLRFGERVAEGDIELVVADIVKEHVDTAQVVGGDVDLLPEEAFPHVFRAKYLGELQKKGT